MYKQPNVIECHCTYVHSSMPSIWLVGSVEVSHAVFGDVFSFVLVVVSARGPIDSEMSGKRDR